jgi:P pilus assembly chaperone PapD
MAGARRVGAIPPVVVVLITISAVVAASLVAWFMWATSKSATSQLLLEVTNAYTPDGKSIFFTLNNVGTQEVNIQQVIGNCTAGVSTYGGTGACDPSQPLKAGQTAACYVVLASALPSGDPTCAVTIKTDRGSAILSVRAARG